MTVSIHLGPVRVKVEVEPPATPGDKAERAYRESLVLRDIERERWRWQLDFV